MNVYYSAMRVKDEIKQQALFEATIKVVNEIGFASSSVSKIAKEAGISPATIYVYYENKEDLLISTYVDIKKSLGAALLTDLDESAPVRDIFKQVWYNGFQYISEHQNLIQFKDQFANSPYLDRVNKDEIEETYEPLTRVFRRGIEQKILKDVSFELFTAFVFQPVMILANSKQCPGFRVGPESIDQAFEMAWDAIKL